MPRPLLEGIYASIARDELKISSGGWVGGWWGGWDCRCWALGRGGGCCGWLAQVLLCTRLPLLPPPPAMRSPLYVEVHCD